MPSQFHPTDQMFRESYNSSSSNDHRGVSQEAIDSAEKDSNEFEERMKQRNKARMDRMVEGCRKEIKGATLFPVEIGKEVFECPIVRISANKKYSYLYAVTGEDDIFPIKRKKVGEEYQYSFVLDEMFRQSSLKKEILKGIGYCVISRW